MISPKGEQKRDRIAEYIFRYREQHGYAPSITEIADEMGTVRSNVHRHLSLLQREGRITSTPHVARSWVVLS